MSPGCAKTIVVVAILALIASPLWWKSPPPLPIGTANGVYANDCCGSIVLKDGLLTFAGGSTKYIVDHDKLSRYVLPEHLIHVTTNRVDMEENSFPLYMRLNDSQPPRTIELAGYQQDYIFTRVPGRPVR